MKYLKNKTENIIIRLTESEKKLIRLKRELIFEPRNVL